MEKQKGRAFCSDTLACGESLECAHDLDLDTQRKKVWYIYYHTEQKLGMLPLFFEMFISLFME